MRPLLAAAAAVLLLAGCQGSPAPAAPHRHCAIPIATPPACTVIGSGGNVPSPGPAKGSGGSGGHA